jgi:hypothetical protein
MELKPIGAKVVDVETSLEAVPVQTSVGPVLWATIRIDYALAGLSPHVDIRVPVSFDRGETDQDRARQALRNARLLIDHACQASGVPGAKLVQEEVRDFLAEMLPTSLQGIGQELGIADPTTKPAKNMGR